MGFLESCLSIGVSAHSGAKRTIVFVNERKFELGCVVSYMERELPDFHLRGLSTIEKITDIPEQAIALVVIDAPVMPGEDSAQIGTIERFAETMPDTAIAVMIGAELECEKLLPGLWSARGIFPATLAPPVVAAIIKVLVAGGTYFHRTALSSMPERSAGAANLHTFACHDESIAKPLTGTQSQTTRMIGQSQIAAIPSFTARESEILAKLAEGLQNKLIAATLCMPENTVKVHIRNIMRKLKATNRTAAVVAAQRMNIIQSMESRLSAAN